MTGQTSSFFYSCVHDLKQYIPFDNSASFPHVGATGDTGASGRPGKNGRDGKSGSTGATGPHGDTGGAGDTGTTGPRGPPGPPGAMTGAWTGAGGECIHLCCSLSMYIAAPLQSF